MSVRDFNGWLSYYNQCGFPHTNQENLLARQAWQFACANSDSKKSPPKLSDYLTRKPRRAMSQDELRRKVKNNMALLGIKPDGERE